MQLLRKHWKDLETWTGVPEHRLIEYVLVAGYAIVALLALIVGLTAKAGSRFGPAIESNPLAGRPEFKSMMKTLLFASEDFMVGASLLVLAAGIVVWGRRDGAPPRPLDRVVPSGPPFLL